MIPGISAADDAAYRAALATHCQVAWRIQQLDLNHRLVSSIDTMHLDGQINMIDASSNGITKSIQATFLDPEHLLRIDGPSPKEGVGGMDRLIKVESLVHSEAEDRWIKAPAGVFWPGGGDELSRDGDTISLAAAAKESLHLRFVPAGHIEEGENWVRAVKRLLMLGGETRFRFPSGLRGNLGADNHYGGANEDRMPWKVATKIADQRDYQLYYDLEGYACLRKLPTTPVWELVEQGPDANTLTRVKTTTSLRDARNRVVIRGTKGSRVATGVAVSAASHPQSAQSLAINGRLLYNTLYEDAPDLRTKAECVRRAKSRLAQLESQQTRVETTTLPFWHAEPYDMWKLRPVGAEAFNHRPLDWSAPMGPADTGMTVGFTATVRKATAGRLRR